MTPHVLIIGAGLSGLNCALELQKKDIPFTILDSSDAVGGRIRTDNIDGFRLDRGFQIFLTAYPEARAVLDYDELNLHSFRPGAMVRLNGKFRLLSDPLRRPQDVFSTLFSGVGTLRDKLKVAMMRRTQDGSMSTGPETSIMEKLQTTWGFSAGMIDSFFKPFLGGITLDENLGTSSRFFDFVMGMFTKGKASFPAGGMQAIPEQMAAKLPAESIILKARVTAINGSHEVILEDGRRFEGSHVVLATGMTDALALDPGATERTWNGTTCHYFAADAAPFNEPVLLLNGEPGRSSGSVNSIVVPSNVAPGYAPKGQHLICLSSIGVDESDASKHRERVLTEAASWFGDEVSTWRHLQTYRITHALPRMDTLPDSPPIRVLDSGIIQCGDHLSTSSINGALASGRHAADHLQQTL